MKIYFGKRFALQFSDCMYLAQKKRILRLNNVSGLNVYNHLSQELFMLL